MNYIDITKIIAATFVSIGGASVVIIGLAKWFGDFLSKRLLDSYNNKHTNELERIKSKYQQELEETKNDLEKAKTQFIRYSEKQFDLYNDLWRVLLYTKLQADDLWKKLNPDKIPAFSEQIKLTKTAIENNLLLIEEEHYNKLLELIRQFEQFQFGKTKLKDFNREFDNLNLSQNDVQNTISANKKTKDKYDKLIAEIGKGFRNQIKG